MHSLNIITWNIESLCKNGVSKLYIPEVKSLVNKFETICLCETWCDKVNFDGYTSYISTRNVKHKHAKRNSGGVAVLVKSGLVKYITRMPSATDDILWLKVNTKQLGLSRDIYLCCSYLVPENSSYLKWQDIEPSSMLEMDVIKYAKLGDIVICGDLNSRTSNKEDYILMDDNCQYISLPLGYSPDKFDIKRRNSDIILNTYGKNLIDLCISSKLCILNGRTTGDRTGKFTCFTNTGQSVVDYNIVSKTLYNRIECFIVHDLYPWSHHCPVSMTINLSLKVNIQDNTKLFNMPAKYIWDKSSSRNFLDALHNIKPHLDGFMNCTYNNTIHGSEAAVSDFTNIIHSACKPSLQKRVYKKKKKSK